MSDWGQMPPQELNESNLPLLLLALLERLRNMNPEGPLELDPGWEQKQNAPDQWGGRFMHPLNRGNQGLRIQDLLNRGQKMWGE